MPQRRTRFTVAASPIEVWAFVRDVHALCSCIPGVEQVRLVDDTTAELTVKEKLGVVPLIVALRAKIDDEDPPHRLHAIATAQHLTMEIDVALQASGAGTEMLGLIDVKGEGPLKPVVDSLFEKRADERAAQFARHLEQRFGVVAPEGIALRVSAAPGGVRGWVARFGARVARLWRRITGTGARD